MDWIQSFKEYFLFLITHLHQMGLEDWQRQNLLLVVVSWLLVRELLWGRIRNQRAKKYYVMVGGGAIV